MSKVNVNEKGFDRRLAAVQGILQKLNLTSAQVTPIAYVDYCPFPFNNYLYKVDLVQPATPTSWVSEQPCTTPLPNEGVSAVIIRFNNPLAEGLNNTNRVENEVAAQFLAREAVLAAGLGSVIPAVYAWAPNRFSKIPDETGFAWTMLEFKDGEDLNNHFPSLPIEVAKDIVEQLAGIFAAIQDIKLPITVDKFGALSINDAGTIVSGQMPLLHGGPWDTYAEVWEAKLQMQLEEAEKSPLLDGWVPGGVRDRLQSFIDSGGVSRVLEGIDTSDRVLIHGDLTTNNILYDKETARITCLLDFDWSSVTHPSEEYLFGLWDIGSGVHERTGRLQPAVLTGDFSVPPKDLSEEESKKWETGKVWNVAATRKSFKHPSSIAGIEKVQTLRELEILICPFALASEVMLNRISEEQKISKRKDAETKILAWLDKQSCKD